MKQHTEDQLMHAEWLEERLKMSANPILVHCEGTVVCANRAVANLLGVDGTSVLEGSPVEDVLSHQIMAQTDPFLESRLVRFDGSQLIVESVSMPLLYEGKPSTLLVFQDITAHKEAEEALRRWEHRYQLLFDSALDAVFMSTPEGTIVDINPAGVRLLGYGSKEQVLSGPHVWDMHMKADARTSLIERLLRDGMVKDFEYELTRTDGERRVVLQSAWAVRGDDGSLVGYQGLIRDVTEHRLLQQQLSQAQKMESIGTLVSGIAHDFNNILNNVNGFASQLQKYPDDPSRVMRYSTTIEKSASRGVALAGQLLSFVRRRQRVDAVTRIQEIIEELALLFGETFPKNILLEKHIDADLWPVMGDRSELYQAVLNICLNARDAMPHGGVLLIDGHNHVPSSEPLVQQLLPNTAYTKISITDTGVGIPRGIRNRVFDPFFTTKERGSGTGLGLSIVYNIVRTHKGHVVVESEEGRGTSFHLYLPAVLVAPQIEHRAGQPADKTPGHELVLLVDDEVTMQELGRELLEEAGYRVLVAGDGEEAVEVYRRHSSAIALVILDLLMPKMDGGTTYLELKKINKNVKAFFCTGYTSDEVITPLLEERKLRALQKPFKPSDFVQTVREVLQG